MQLLQKKNTNEKISLKKGVTCADKSTSGLSSRGECNVKKPKVFHDPQKLFRGLEQHFLNCANHELRFPAKNIWILTLFC